MEFLLVIFGLLGLVALLGGLISFISLFSGADDKARLSQRLAAIENQLQALSDRVDVLSIKVKIPASSLSPDSPPSLASQPATATSPSRPPPGADAALDKEDLTEQALAAAPTSEPSTTSKVTMQEIVKETWQENEKPQKVIEPGLMVKSLIAARNWLFGGNTLVRSGIVILFIGISFLLKYAAEHTYVPIEFRLAAIALAGVALLVLGWRLRVKRTEYSWALQGGGVGILYLTIFAAFKLYELIPANIAFILLIAVAFLSALIAVMQSAIALAVLGFSGGFLAPIFTSTGHGSHISLFSYYLVLNLGITFIAFYKSWRPLNVLGFVFTFVIGSLWGAKSYVPELFASTEPFLIIHFVLFNLIAILYAYRQSTKASDYVDATLVFGTPIVGFSLQYALLHDAHFGLAYSALALAIFYIALAWWTLTRKRETLQFLGECFLALGIGFATLTLPLALDGRWTSAAWAVEGVALVWAGLRQNRSLPLCAGLALQLLGAAAFINGWGLTGYAPAGHQNMFLGVAFIALSGWACGALLNRYRFEKTTYLTSLLAIWGWLWWVGAGFTAIDEFLPHSMFNHIGLLFIAITSLLLPITARSWNWPKLARLSLLLLPCMVIGTFSEFAETHPLANYGWISWPFAFAAQAWLLRQNVIKTGVLMRAPLLWILALIGIMEWKFWLSAYVYEATVWRDIGWAVIPLAIVAAVTYWQTHMQKADAEPAFNNRRAWLWFGCSPLVVFLLGWFALMSLYSSGNPSPLAYIPLLNPLDITLSAILLLLLVWKRYIATSFLTNNFAGMLNSIVPPLAGLMGFALLNGMLLRSLHYWAQTPFAWTAIFNYTLVQVSFTFLWGIIALILMLVAHRHVQRNLWIVGAALMGLVVLKLFLLDLAEHGSVERIVSFIGAGLLLLLMGYFAPLPPAIKALVATKGTDE